MQNEKNSIVQAASTEIQDLQRRKEELQRRNRDLEAGLGVVGEEDNDMVMGGTKIKIRIGNPASGIESMLQVLGCLDSLGLEMASVRSSFSTEEFSAAVEIQEEVVNPIRLHFTALHIAMMRLPTPFHQTGISRCLSADSFYSIFQITKF